METNGVITIWGEVIPNFYGIDQGNALEISPTGQVSGVD
jgi:hypothetical protein